jgi:flagellar hook-associated protein 3 FlgL
MAEVIMNLKMQENVYRASLSAGARIIQPSLVDFLR